MDEDEELTEDEANFVVFAACNPAKQSWRSLLPIACEVGLGLTSVAGNMFKSLYCITMSDQVWRDRQADRRTFQEEMAEAIASMPQTED